MSQEEYYEQCKNDLRALKGLIIQLSLPSLALPIPKPKLSVSMTLKVIESLQEHVWEMEYYINGPSEAELEFEQSLLNDVSQEDIDEEQMKSVLAS
jgi:hypothetical protein